MKIFVSYSRVDRAATAQFVRRLERIDRDHDVWYDDELLGGDVWWDEILDQIAACDLFIYVLSQDSVNSPYCQAEFTEARRLQKRIITIQLSPNIELKGELSDIQYVDMKDGMNNADSIERLAAAVNKQAKNLPPRRPRALWQPRTLRPQSPAEIEAELQAQQAASKPNTQAGGEPRSTSSKSPRFLRMNRGTSIVAIGILLAAIGAIYLYSSGAFSGSPSPARPQEASSASLTLASTPVATNRDWTAVMENFDGEDMVLVPAGTFQMGSETGQEDEKSVHPQEFKEPFWIDRYEVTNRQYRNCVAVFQCELPFGTSFYDNQAFADHPIVYVNWLQATAFCQFRGKRLPTEREWEYAARGPDDLVYPWGNSFNRDLPIWNVGGPELVGTKPDGASWVGALDMSGNVWEWVSSAYIAYPYSAEAETGESNLIHTVRGGSWFVKDMAILRTTQREQLNINMEGNNIGFRCVRDA